MDGTIGFLGCGNMGGALLDGWLAAGALAPRQVWISDPAGAGGRVGVATGDAQAVVDAADVVVLAVKPKQVAPLLDALRFSAETLVVSVVAGLNCEALAAHCAPARVVRTMPNVAARVRAGATLVFGGQGSTAADVTQVKALFDTVGLAEVLSDEALFHGATALSGCGPAYLFLAMEAMADGAVATGVPRAQAYRLAAQTVLGAGRLALETGLHPAVLKDQVTSPGGVTIQAVGQLERGGFRAALFNAIMTAAARSEEMESA